MEDYKIDPAKNIAENSVLKRCEEIASDLRVLRAIYTADARNTADIMEKLILCKRTMDALRRDLYTSMREYHGGCKVCVNWDAECVPEIGNCHPVWRGLCKENCEELEENKLRNDSL